MTTLARSGTAFSLAAATEESNAVLGGKCGLFLIGLVNRTTLRQGFIVQEMAVQVILALDNLWLETRLVVVRHCEGILN